jgi:hypothetical protein
MTTLQTIVELPEFIRRAKAIMTDDERVALVDYIAANPEAGASLGGGLRKVRIPPKAAARAVATGPSMCSHGAHLPIFLVTVFAKKEKDNLTRTEQAAAVALAKTLVATYGDRR